MATMNDPKSETKLLAYLFHNPDTIGAYPFDLFTENRRKLYAAMVQAQSDYDTLTPEALEKYYDGDIGEILLGDVYDSKPLLDTLKRLQQARNMFLAAQEIQAQAQALAESDKHRVDLSSVEDQLFFADSTEYDSTLTSASQTVLKNTQKKKDREYHFISTGYRFLDTMFGGEWPKRAVSVVIADPGGSKTSLICNSALRMGKRGDPSLIISMEMAKQELISRWLSDLTNTDNMLISTGDVDISVLEDATNELNKLPLYVVDDSDLTIDSIASIIRTHVKKGIHVVFIDYLQLINVGDDRNKELGRAVKLLKRLAKKYSIHICIVAQKNAKDGVWAIRDSGDVPAHVDIIINIMFDDTNSDDRMANFEFVKHRNGRIGKVPALFQAKFLRYVSN